MTQSPPSPHSSSEDRRAADRRRRWRRAGGGIAVLGLLGLYLLNARGPGARPEGCLQTCAERVPQSADVLRVLSVNVLHDFPRFRQLAQRLDLIAREIRRLDADIVLLQEAPWVVGLGNSAEYLAQAAGLNHVFIRSNGNRWTILFEEGVAILSRYPLDDPGFVELQPQEGPFQHRVALHATAVTPLGAVDLYVTHLTDISAEINQAQAAVVRDFVARTAAGPALIAGDFNAAEATPPIRELTRSWVDAYRAAFPGESGSTCCVEDLHGAPGEALEARIDYVFVAPGGERRLAVREVRLAFDQPFAVGEGWQWASDHAGLLVVVAAGD